MHADLGVQTEVEMEESYLCNNLDEETETRVVNVLFQLERLTAHTPSNSQVRYLDPSTLHCTVLCYTLIGLLMLKLVYLCSTVQSYF